MLCEIKLWPALLMGRTVNHKTGEGGGGGAMKEMDDEVRRTESEEHDESDRRFDGFVPPDDTS